MANEENDTSAAATKPPSTQEQPPPSSPATVFHDWSSFQAYYSSAGTPTIPPPAFFHSPMASSPQAHPYIWGQHMIPPYGTPPGPYVMYPHGGIYAHPSMPPGSHPYSPRTMLSPNGTAETAVAPTSGRESESKSGDGNKKNPLKRSKGSLGSLNMLTGKDNEASKASGASNGGLSHSGESGGEDSSEGSDANSQNDSQHSGKGSADVGTQNGGTLCSVSSGVSQPFPSQAIVNTSMVMTVPPNSISAPTTNLNIGMDYWGGANPPPVAAGRAKLPTVQPPGPVVAPNLMGSREGIPSELWIQDERELKRQRRKQSNRESARRSRLRKQAEYDELAQRVESLREDNGLLREELLRMQEECEKLSSENASLTEKLQKLVGQDSRADAVNGQPESDSKVAANVNSPEKDI